MLYVQSIAEKKQRRQDSVQNQLRLGRFITQRKGAQFVEVWVDGFAFTDLLQRQEAVCSQREELERQRKQLTKRKPSSAGGQGQGGTGAGGKASRGGKQATVAASGEDGFTKPSALMSLSPQEYMERDELFKIRAALLKKVSHLWLIQPMTSLTLYTGRCQSSARVGETAEREKFAHQRTKTLNS